MFAWDGDDPGDVAGTNIDGYATDAGPFPGESDNEPIPWYDLYPGPPPLPFNTGVAIDIGVAEPSLPPGPFRWVRISSPPGGGDPSEIDSILRLH